MVNVTGCLVSAGNMPAIDQKLQSIAIRVPVAPFNSRLR